jgi:hypothetical protein
VVVYDIPSQILVVYEPDRTQTRTGKPGYVLDPRVNHQERKPGLSSKDWQGTTFFRPKYVVVNTVCIHLCARWLRLILIRLQACLIVEIVGEGVNIPASAAWFRLNH